MANVFKNGERPPVNLFLAKEDFIQQQINADGRYFQPNPRADENRRIICGHLFEALNAVYSLYPDAAQEHASLLVLNCVQFVKRDSFLAAAIVMHRENGEKTLGYVNLDAEIDGLFAHIHDLPDEVMAKIDTIVAEHQDTIPASDEPE